MSFIRKEEQKINGLQLVYMEINQQYSGSNDISLLDCTDIPFACLLDGVFMS